ncbi:acetate--CoA ligase family protein [Pseudonocardia acaciae]|uniref:acetate--CoA ligase family protein n=1 Tax=Pseudonocardia acaciae TaxID=551276 RepID=UPI000686F05A|nr:acetate--CoA ligase [Pseudonocardia acaciae]
MTDTVGAGRRAGTDWDRVFRPRAVALLGATGRPESLMGRPLRWLAERGYPGRIYPVNPKYDELAGARCYPTMDALPEPVDLVLALVPAAASVDAVRAAGAAGAEAVVVFASGFAEVGPEGARLQRRLAAAGRDAGVRVFGPNCQGIYYAPSRLFATFSAAAERPLADSCGIAYVGQSGALGGSVLDLAAERGLDLTAWVSTGNQADVDLTEVGRWLVRDPEVSVLAVYAESIADGEAYELLAAEAARAGTALVVLRSGRSVAGRRAAVSHTGAMLADDTAFTLVSHRHGVVLANDVDELLAAATALRGQPRPAGRRIAAVSTSGGAGILAADACEANGLTLPELAPHTRRGLARLVPEFGALANPVDVTAQLFNSGRSAFGEVCSIVAADPSVDALLVLLTMVTGDAAVELAEDLARAVTGVSRVPCSVVWLAGPDRTAPARAILGAAGIPVFSSVTVAARVAGALAPHTSLQSPTPQAGLPRAPLPEDGWALLDALGIGRPDARLVHTARQAADAAAELGADGPLVLKAVAPGLEHKSDAGGIRLGVTAAEAAAVFDDLVTAVPGATGVLIQRTVPAGLELLVGATGGREGWPPLLTVGLGGVGTEIHRDLATTLAPVTPEAARALLRELRCWPLLAGHRGAPPLDVDAAVDAITRVGHAVAHWPELAELEINPLIVGPSGQGAVAVDVLMKER